MIGPHGENLAFILGLPRSGTTLLSVMLGKHHEIYVPPEPWLMLALESLGKTSPRHPANSQVIGGALQEFLGEEGMLNVARAAALEAYNSKLAQVGRPWLADKTPRYYLILPFLRKMFPAAKFIWLTRNPAAVAASYKTTWGMDLPGLLAGGGDNWAYYDLVLGPRRLLQFCREMHGAVYWIKYEDLVQNPEQHLRQLTNWIGLWPVDGLSEFNTDGATATSYAGDKKIVGTQRPHADSIDAWESVFSNEELQVLLDAVGAEVFQQSGYGKVLERFAQRGVYARTPEITQSYVDRADALLSNRWQDVAEASTPPQSAGEESLAAGARPERADVVIQHVRRELAEKETALEQAKSNAIQLNGELATLRDAYGKLLLDRNTWAEQAKHLAAVVQGYEEPTFKKLLVRAQKLAAVWVIGRPGLVAKAQRPLPKISLVTPCFNAAHTIGDAIESVRAQKYENLEYIVVDGGSTDGTQKILSDYQAAGVIAKVISEPDNGMYDAIRKGFAVATGEIFCYLNADDAFEPGGLRRVGEYFRDHPRVNLIYHEDTVQINGWLFANSRQVHCDTIELMRGYMLFQDGVFWRRGLYEVIGGASGTLRFAGDYDLWLRMSRAAKFVRRPAHVSRFRIRHGQLSSNMNKYRAEQQVIRRKFWTGLPFIAKARIRALHGVTVVKNICHVLRRRHLYFAMDLQNLPPPVTTPPPRIVDAPRCPLTGAPPDRLLFSTPDTRYGDKAINYVYYNSASGVAMAYPPRSESELTALYAEHYSNADARPIEPPEGSTSPYRKWFGGGWMDRLLFKRFYLISQLRNKNFSWNDPTVNELLSVTDPRFPWHGRRLSFLDVGCFRGELLDKLKTATDWDLAGLEPNERAVAVAREKGHKVWPASAADAPYVIPEGVSFDLIFLGQTIEHFTDPVGVMRRLRMLLAPGGAIVLSTPNLDSRQIDLFGPTWAHWHIPYHRALYSRRSIELLASQSELRMDKFVTHSHPYWSAMSLWLNEFGLAGAVPHGQSPPTRHCARAVELSQYARWFWNWRGRGDYLYAMFSPRGGQ